MKLLLLIVAANLMSRLTALVLAGVVSFRLLSRFAGPIACFSAGLLLTVSVTHLIPEAMHSGVSAWTAGIVVCAALAAFFALDGLLHKAFGHRHGASEVPAYEKGRVFSLVVGTACHNFVDGILIATAFMADVTVGFLVTAAVFAHELPQLVGHLVLLTSFGLNRLQALAVCCGTALLSVLGGVVGFLVFDVAQFLVPYAMLVSAGSFLFVVCAVVRAQCARLKGTLSPLPGQLAGVAAGAAVSLFLLMPLHDSAHHALYESGSSASIGHVHEDAHENDHDHADERPDHGHAHRH